jgi:dUTP pyrophosphatase
MNLNMPIKKLDNFVVLPEYKTAGAVAMDLYAAESVILKNGKISIVKTGVAISVPEGHEGQIRARSGMASKGIIVVNSPGTIDFDFTGELCVILSYIKKGQFVIEKCDRIAQLVIAPVAQVNLVIVETLNETVRGTKGFGSTGIK